jgi:dTDP-glucose 4,6-dehydratase
MIFCALQGKALPVYGKGENIRDWIHVKDHARGVLLALTRGIPGETYCFGGNSERTNLEVVNALCAELDSVRPMKEGRFESLIKFVTDRPGHDFRYAIDDSKAQRELGFTREYLRFEDGLRETIQWYLKHVEWSKKVTSKNGAKTTYDWSMLGG